MLPVFRRFSRANVLGSFSVHPPLRSSTFLSSLRPPMWFHLPFLHHYVDDFFLLVLLLPPVARPRGLRLLRAYQHADTLFPTSPVITRSRISMRFPLWPFYKVFWLSNASAIWMYNLLLLLMMVMMMTMMLQSYGILQEFHMLCPRDVVQGTSLGMGNRMRNGAVSGRLERGLGFGQVMDY